MATSAQPLLGPLPEDEIMDIVKNISGDLEDGVTEDTEPGSGKLAVSTSSARILHISGGSVAW